MDPMRLEPNNIQQIGDELAIAWNDGTESFLKVELLRRACPCAACGGEPDVLGQIVRPHVSYTGQKLRACRIRFRGRLCTAAPLGGWTQHRDL